MKCASEYFPLYIPESKAESDLIQKAYEYQVARTAVYRAVHKMDRAAVSLQDAMKEYRIGQMQAVPVKE